MSAELAPLPQFFWPMVTGAAGTGYQLYTYAAGTTTPLATYTDETGLTPNTNPVVLNASGFASVWIGNNSYKFVLYDANSNLIWSQDNIQSIASQIVAVSSQILSVNMAYAQFQTAGLSNPVQAFSLPANSVLEWVAIKHATAFAGTAITDVYAGLGTSSGSYQNCIEHFDVYQSVADGTYDSATVFDIFSFANPTPIYLNLTSVGANLSALTAGALTVYYKYEVL